MASLPPVTNRKILRAIAPFLQAQKPRFMGSRVFPGGIYTEIGTGSTAAHNSARTWQSFIPASDIGGVSIEFGNWFLNANAASSAGANSVTISACVEYPISRLTQLTFDGSATKVVTAGANVTSDPLFIYIPANATAIIRLFTIVTGGGAGRIVSSFAPVVSFGEGMTSGASLTDHTTTTVGTSPTGTGAGPGCMAIYGYPTDITTRSVVLIGDSEIFGRGDSSDGTSASPTGDGFGNFGPYQRALYNAGIGVCRMCKSGQLGRDMSGLGAGAYWKDVVRGATTAFVQLGTNDLGVNYLFNETQAFMLDIYTWLASNGCRVVPCTLPPRTIDGTNTAIYLPSVNTNAFQPGSASDRGLLNAWIRTLPTTLPYVPGIIDGGDAVESFRDSGFWKTNTASVRYQADGTHWSIAGGGSTSGGIEVVRDVVAAAIASGIVR